MKYEMIRGIDFNVKRILEDDTYYVGVISMLLCINDIYELVQFKHRNIYIFISYPFPFMFLLVEKIVKFKY